MVEVKKPNFYGNEQSMLHFDDYAGALFLSLRDPFGQAYSLG